MNQEQPRIIGPAMSKVIAQASRFLNKHKDIPNAPQIKEENGKKLVSSSSSWGVTVKIKEYQLMESKYPDGVLWSECEVWLSPAKMYNWIKELGSPTGKFSVQAMGLELSFYPNCKEVNNEGVLILTSTQGAENLTNSTLLSSSGVTALKAMENCVRLSAPQGETRKFVENILLLRVIRASDGRVVRIR